MLLLTKQLLFLPTAFRDTLASGYGECGVVSAADPAVSADNFVLGSSQPMSVHPLQSTHCHFYVPTTAHTTSSSLHHVGISCKHHHVQHANMHIQL